MTALNEKNEGGLDSMNSNIKKIGLLGGDMRQMIAGHAQKQKELTGGEFYPFMIPAFHGFVCGCAFQN